jgi:V8-like Glu-specific endopeptidase
LVGELLERFVLSPQVDPKSTLTARDHRELEYLARHHALALRELIVKLANQIPDDIRSAFADGHPNNRVDPDLLKDVRKRLLERAEQLHAAAVRYEDALGRYPTHRQRTNGPPDPSDRGSATTSSMVALGTAVGLGGLAVSPNWLPLPVLVAGAALTAVAGVLVAVLRHVVQARAPPRMPPPDGVLALEPLSAEALQALAEEFPAAWRRGRLDSSKLPRAAAPVRVVDHKDLAVILLNRGVELAARVSVVLFAVNGELFTTHMWVSQVQKYIEWGLLEPGWFADAVEAMMSGSEADKKRLIASLVWAQNIERTANEIKKEVNQQGRDVMRIDELGQRLGWEWVDLAVEAAPFLTREGQLVIVLPTKLVPRITLIVSIDNARLGSLSLIPPYLDGVPESKKEGIKGYGPAGVAAMALQTMVSLGVGAEVSVAEALSLVADMWRASTEPFAVIGLGVPNWVSTEMYEVVIKDPSSAQSQPWHLAVRHDDVLGRALINLYRPSGIGPKLNPDAVNTQLENVVQVKTHDGRKGTGYVTKRDQFLTADHVVRDPETGQMRQITVDGRSAGDVTLYTWGDVGYLPAFRSTVSLERPMTGPDVADVEVHGVERHGGPVRFASPPEGSVVIHVGYPNGWPTVLPGPLITNRRFHMTMQARSVGGSSGGPVLNADGTFAGVTISASHPAMPSNFVGVVPAELLRRPSSQIGMRGDHNRREDGAVLLGPLADESHRQALERVAVNAGRVVYPLPAGAWPDKDPAPEVWLLQAPQAVGATPEVMAPLGAYVLDEGIYIPEVLVEEIGEHVAAGRLRRDWLARLLRKAYELAESGMDRAERDIFAEHLAEELNAARTKELAGGARTRHGHTLSAEDLKQLGTQFYRFRHLLTHSGR